MTRHNPAKAGPTAYSRTEPFADRIIAAAAVICVYIVFQAALMWAGTSYE